MITQYWNHNTLSLVIICLFLISAAALGACAEPAPAPVPTPTPPAPTPLPTPTPAPEPATAERWAADGILTSEEYLGEMKYGDYEIRWVSDEQYIYVGMKAKTDGWVAMAFQPGSTMKDADMVFGFVKDGVTTVYDLFSTGTFGPHPPDTELGGTDDIIEFGGKEEGGYTTIEFKRALDTGDEYDNPLSKGSNKIIWSYGSDDKLTPKHSHRGYGEIEL